MASQTRRPAEALVISRTEVAQLLTIDACIAAVENAFRTHARGGTHPPSVLGVHVDGGGFHVKTAGLKSDPDEPRRAVFAAKVNANFPGNPERHGLPTIQGVLALFDAENGTPLALLDSIEITSQRTAAATAVAARYLARPDSSRVTICGCGEQGRSQLRALMRVREIREVLAFDVVRERAARFAREMAVELPNVSIAPVDDLTPATRRSDICVTCTTSRTALLGPDDVGPGSFIAAVGADNPEKQELAPALLASSTVVVDILDQCATIGDLHHAIAAGAMRREDVHAELAEVVAGHKPGRRSKEEIIVFDSTGTALEDVAVAALVYDRALATGVGLRVALSA
jgi:alanine dehydrogenase